MLLGKVEGLHRKVILTAIHDDEPLLSRVSRSSQLLEVLNPVVSDNIVDIARRRSRESCVFREVICEPFDLKDDTGMIINGSITSPVSRVARIL